MSPLLCEYFSPYVSADMRKMATAFNTTVAALEDELAQLILEGLINAIDSTARWPDSGPWGAGGGPWAPLNLPPQILYARDSRSAQHHL